MIVCKWYYHCHWYSLLTRITVSKQFKAEQFISMFYMRDKWKWKSYLMFNICQLSDVKISEMRLSLLVGKWVTKGQKSMQIINFFFLSLSLCISMKRLLCAISIKQFSTFNSQTVQLRFVVKVTLIHYYYSIVV